jgi:hypothetical protein
LKAYVEENRTGSRFTYAEKEGVEGGKERRNGGRAIGGRDQKLRKTVPGLRQITCRMVLTQKLRALREKTGKSRHNWSVSGGGVGA